jgi:hypothetical protein
MMKYLYIAKYPLCGGYCGRLGTVCENLQSKKFRIRIARIVSLVYAVTWHYKAIIWL